MTEQKAIEFLKMYLDEELYLKKCVEAHSMAIQALEKQSMVNEILNELKQYREIGTVEELQALKEKSVAKKPIEKEHTYDWFGTRQLRVNFYCPSCNELVENDYCKCGQHLDWE